MRRSAAPEGTSVESTFVVTVPAASNAPATESRRTDASIPRLSTCMPSAVRICSSTDVLRLRPSCASTAMRAVSAMRYVAGLTGGTTYASVGAVISGAGGADAQATSPSAIIAAMQNLISLRIDSKPVRRDGTRQLGCTAAPRAAMLLWRADPHVR